MVAALLAAAAPARPAAGDMSFLVRAGAVVTASVRVTSAGAPVRPTGVRCAGSIGNAKVRGVPGATTGRASCTYRTPVDAKGKTLRGSILLTVRDKRYLRRFATRLR
jgi:hypothetical protein